MTNPATIPTPVKDIQGDKRWMSMVRHKDWWLVPMNSPTVASKLKKAWFVWQRDTVSKNQVSCPRMQDNDSSQSLNPDCSI